MRISWGRSGIWLWNAESREGQRTSGYEKDLPAEIRDVFRLVEDGQVGFRIEHHCDGEQVDARLLVMVCEEARSLEVIAGWLGEERGGMYLAYLYAVLDANDLNVNACTAKLYAIC